MTLNMNESENEQSRAWSDSVFFFFFFTFNPPKLWSILAERKSKKVNVVYCLIQCISLYHVLKALLLTLHITSCSLFSHVLLWYSIWMKHHKWHLNKTLKMKEHTAHVAKMKLWSRNHVVPETLLENRFGVSKADKFTRFLLCICETSICAYTASKYRMEDVWRE